MSSSLRLDGQLDHRFAVNLPIEKRQGDGGLCPSITRWLARGSSLPRDYRHIHLRSTSPVVKEKPRRDLEAYAVGDRVTPRPGTRSFAYGGTAQQCNVQSGMIGEVMAAIQGSDGCDVMVDFPMPPTEWDSAPRPIRLWMKAGELRLVQVAADSAAQAKAAAATLLNATGPPRPIAVKAEVLDSALILAWEVPLDFTAAHYELQMTEVLDAPKSGGPESSTFSARSNGYVVKGLPQGSRHEVRIRSKTTDGFTSAWTDPLVVTVAPGEVLKTEDMSPNPYAMFSPEPSDAQPAPAPAPAPAPEPEPEPEPEPAAAVQDTETDASVEPGQAAEELAVDSHPTVAPATQDESAAEDTPAPVQDKSNKGAERVEQAAEQRRSDW